MAQIVKNLPAMWETQVLSLGPEDPLEWLPTPAFLPGEFHDRGTWRATIHGLAKKLEMTEQLTYTHNKGTNKYFQF